MSDRELIVVWRVTEACALACGFCAYDRRLAGARRSADPAQLVRFGARLAALPSTRVLLSFLGGEPMTWAPLDGVARSLSAMGLALSVTTSGVTLGDPATRRWLLEHFAEVTISVDGIGEVHDRLRGWRGGFARLEAAVARLAAERRDGRPRLRVNSVLMSDTVHDFPALCDRLAGWGVDEITFNQLGGRDRPEFHARRRLTEAQAHWVAAALPGWQADLGRRGVRLGGSDGYGQRLIASARGQRLPVADCGPGARFLFVDEDGVAAPCSFTGAALGISVDDLDPAELATRFGARGRAPACDDCPSTQVTGKFGYAGAR